LCVARPHLEASEVFVTGTFDDWGKTEKLDKVGDTFEKEVQLPDASKKIFYKVRQGNYPYLCPSHEPL
jgi:Glycogen recognition site of AMP-activated protein kinase